MDEEGTLVITGSADRVGSQTLIASVCRVNTILAITQRVMYLSLILKINGCYIQQILDVLNAYQKEGRKEMFYLIMHSTHFYLRLYGVRNIVKHHSDTKKEGNPLLSLHELLFPISSKGSFICTIPQTV